MIRPARLSIRVEPPSSGRGGHPIAFDVDGRDIRELAAEVERPFADADKQPDLAGQYSLMEEPEVRHWSQTDPDGVETVWLAGCECGEAGCWPLEARVVRSAIEVKWDLFTQPHRRHWTYEDLGGFAFQRVQFEDAFAAAGLEPLVPRSWPDRHPDVLPDADPENIELAGWGYDAHPDIWDIVNHRMGVARDRMNGVVSNVCLSFAWALGKTLGTTPRQQLKSYVQRLVESRNEPVLESQRAELLTEWFINEFATSWLARVGAAVPTAVEDWRTLRNSLRERRSRLPVAAQAWIRMMPSSTGWDQPPGGELLHLVNDVVESHVTRSLEQTRILWSACWYAAVIAKTEGGPKTMAEAGGEVADSSFRLLDAMLVRR